MCAFLLVATFVAAFLHPVPLYGTETDLLGDYIPAARGLATLRPSLEHFATKGPVYPLLLAATTPLTMGDAFLAAKLLNCVAAATAGWVVFLLFGRAFGNLVGLGAMVAMLATPTFMQATLEAGTDMPALALALAATWLASRCRRGRSFILAGIVTGLACLTRSNYLFLPIVGLAILLKNHQGPAAVLRYLTSVASPFVAWWVFCLATVRALPPDTNYLNVAYALYGSGGTWEHFFADRASQFHSYAQVLAFAPKVAAERLAMNITMNWARDLTQLIPTSMGLVTLTGVVLNWRLVAMAPTLYVNGVLAYFVLCTVFYEPRFGLYLLPFYLSGVGLLLSANGRPTAWLRNGGAGSVVRRASAIVLSIAIAAMVAGTGWAGIRRVHELLAAAPEETRVVGLALGRLGPTGATVLARKPHVAYYAGMTYSPLWREQGVSDLALRAFLERATYAFISPVEASLRPEYAVLQDSGLVLPGLRQVLFWRNRHGKGSAVYSIERPLWPEARQRVSLADSLERQLSDRGWEGELAIGGELLRAQEFGRALEHLAIAESLNSQSADVAALQSNAYHAIRNYEAAARACLRSMALGGATAQHYGQLGRIRYMQGKYRDASSAFRMALSMDPTDTGSLYLLGLSLYQAAEFKAATAPLLAYVRIVPEAAVAREMAALSMARSGDQAGAIALLENRPLGAASGGSELGALADSLKRVHEVR